uniref:Uncharacterized protein n=1 Tax=Ixodes ricinus TaxID=34613 RepID=A0A6B0UFS6_IXORI
MYWQHDRDFEPTSPVCETNLIAISKCEIPGFESYLFTRDIYFFLLCVLSLRVFPLAMSDTRTSFVFHRRALSNRLFGHLYPVSLCNPIFSDGKKNIFTPCSPF